MKLTYTSEQVQKLLDFGLGKTREVSASASALITDGMLIVDATTATITLPLLADAWDATLEVGTRIIIQKATGSALGVITVDGNGSNIEGMATNTDINTAGENLQVVATATEWKIV